MTYSLDALKHRRQELRPICLLSPTAADEKRYLGMFCTRFLEADNSIPGKLKGPNLIIYRYLQAIGRKIGQIRPGAEFLSRAIVEEIYFSFRNLLSGSKPNTMRGGTDRSFRCILT